MTEIGSLVTAVMGGDLTALQALYDKLIEAGRERQLAAFGLATADVANGPLYATRADPVADWAGVCRRLRAVFWFELYTPAETAELVRPLLPEDPGGAEESLLRRRQEARDQRQAESTGLARAQLERLAEQARVAAAVKAATARSISNPPDTPRGPTKWLE